MISKLKQKRFQGRFNCLPSSDQQIHHILFANILSVSNSRLAINEPWPTEKYSSFTIILFFEMWAKIESGFEWLYSRRCEINWRLTPEVFQISQLNFPMLHGRKQRHMFLYFRQYFKFVSNYSSSRSFESLSLFGILFTLINSWKLPKTDELTIFVLNRFYSIRWHGLDIEKALNC